jgi:hypothetical protein
MDFFESYLNSLKTRKGLTKLMIFGFLLTFLGTGFSFPSVEAEGYTLSYDFNGEDCCDEVDKPADLVMQYTGQSCSATSHMQDNNKVTCSGDPRSAATVRIVMSEKANGSGKVYFNGTVQLNAFFTAKASNAGENKLKAETYYTVYSTSGGVLQSGKFHTSCSQPLISGNQFGSLKLISIVGEKGEFCGPPIPETCNEICDAGRIGNDEENCEGFNPALISEINPVEVCDDPPAGGSQDCCEETGKIVSITIRYTGDNCSATSHNQESSKVSCSGNLNGTQQVKITLSTSSNGGGDKYFSGTVSLDGTFEAKASSAGESKFKANTYFFITDLQNRVLQSGFFHTSCSQPIGSGDQFGALRIVGITGEDGTCGNTGSEQPELEYLWLSSVNGCPTDSATQKINGATGATYDPPFINQTTWYTRWVRTVCIPSTSGESCCDDGKPKKLLMTYTGLGCAGSSNSQPSDKFDCNGGANNTARVRIILSEKSNGDNPYFNGLVNLGQAFIASADREFKANTYFSIRTTSGQVLESGYFHTSCSQPLNAGDSFGSLRLEGLETKEGDVCGTIDPNSVNNEENKIYSAWKSSNCVIKKVDPKINSVNISNVVCNDNNTPFDPSDDRFYFDILVSGTGSTWFSTINGVNVTGNYGIKKTFGPYPISGGNLNLIVKDSGNSDCTESVTVVAPPTCSDNIPCEITANVLSPVCNDNGTPSNPSDDYYTFDVTVFSTGDCQSNTWTGGGKSGSYGVTTTFGPYPIGSTQNFTISNADGNTATILVTSPPACSNADPCEITANVQMPICNNNGTPSNPADDYYTFDVTVFKSGDCNSIFWTGGGRSGAYGTTVTFGPYPIGSNQSFVITNTDGSSTTVNVTSPASCSNADPCEITANVQSPICNDNGTPFNPADDYYTFDVTVFKTGDCNSTFWTGGGRSGAYGTTVTFGPYPIGSNQSFVITNTDGSSATVNVVSPASCSNQQPCSISLQILDKICDDNGTPANPADDTYTFKITAQGSNGSGSWNGNFDNAFLGAYAIGNTPYGTSVQVGPFPIGYDINVYVRDAQDADCKDNTTVVSPPPCSNVNVTNKIGDYVWNDLNGNGIQESNEPGIGGVWVILEDCNGIFKNVTFTDPTGMYMFSDLPAGTYKIRFANPGGFVFTNRNTTNDAADSDVNEYGYTDCFTVTPTTIDLTIDAGLTTFNPEVCVVTGSVSNIVCDDNGTATDPSDDTFTFDVTASAINDGDWGWAIPSLGLYYLPYDQPVNLGPYPISGGNVTIVIRDQDKLDCTTTITAVAPAPCSTGPSCNPFTNGGTIQGNQANCGAFDPAPITNLVLPSGGSGAVEYMWLSSTTGCPTSVSQAIPGANGPSYDPGYLTQTTWFVRCARRANCTDWSPGESNCIKIEINNCGNLSLTCNNDIQISAAQGQNSAIVTYTIPTATTTCGNGAVNVVRTGGLASGSAFPVGTTTVTYQAEDVCGNNAICTFKVIVTPATTGGGSCNDFPNYSCAGAGPKGNQPWWEWIEKVEFGGISNTSSKDLYKFFSDVSQASINAGASYVMNLTPGLSWAGYQTDLYWRVWIDYNRDGDFNDPGEMVVEVTNGTNQVSRTIQVPANAQAGGSRMRIAVQRGAYAGPCENFNYGEVEDYKVCIGGGTTDPCASLGGDSDNDGVCDNLDCQPNNPNIPATPGTPCNDGNPQSFGDVIQADGCTCAGFIEPCFISPIASDIACNDNGTPSDPEDDTYTFNVSVARTGGCNSSFWTGGGKTGSYNTPVVFGPYLIKNGNTTLVISNSDGASETLVVAAPASCSNVQALCQERTVTNNKLCNSNTQYALYLPLNYSGQSNLSHYYKVVNGILKEYEDGSATFTGTFQNENNASFRMYGEVTFSNRVNTAPVGSPKNGLCYYGNGSGFYYYQNISGSLTGQGNFAGMKLNISRRGPAFQVGIGANLNETTKMGASGWFAVDLVAQTNTGSISNIGDSDFNWNVSGDPGVCLPAVNNCNRSVLFVTGTTSLGSGDQNVKNRLVELGFDVDVRDDDQLQTSDANGYGLVLVSSTCNSLKLNGKLRDVQVPVMVYEPWIFDDMRMTGSSSADFGKWGSGKRCKIVNSQHPIASGLSGMVEVYNNNQSFHWGRPGTGATKIAELEGYDYMSPVFVYEKSAQMIGMVAPARRVGFYFDNYSSPMCNNNGWKLFDAAVLWATECSAIVNGARIGTTAFDAALDQGVVNLSWVNNTGYKTDKFVVEKSLDGENFEPFIESATQDLSDDLKFYKQLDKNPVTGFNYYRLKNVYLDGSFEFSQVEQIKIDDIEEFGLFPNPANEKVQVSLRGYAGKDITIQLVDQLGRLVKEETIENAVDGVYELETGRYQDGIYTLWIFANEIKPMGKKLIISKW